LPSGWNRKITIDNIYTYDVFVLACFTWETIACIFGLARPENRFPVTDEKGGRE
jgi:hypothetical protein